MGVIYLYPCYMSCMNCQKVQKASKVYRRLSEVLGLTDETMVLSVFIRKMYVIFNFFRFHLMYAYVCYAGI